MVNTNLQSSCVEFKYYLPMNPDSHNIPKRKNLEEKDVSKPLYNHYSSKEFHSTLFFHKKNLSSPASLALVFKFEFKVIF